MRVQSMFEDSDKVSDKKNSDDKDIKKWYLCRSYMKVYLENLR